MCAVTTDSTPLPSLRAQTRNLPRERNTSSCSGDGGSQSAMTMKNGKVVRFGAITLPASKSESNRALMIAAYGGFEPDFQNLSDSKDTLVLKNALLSIDALAPSVARHDMVNDEIFRHVIPSREASVSMPKNVQRIINIADCGTAARFLTTYLACHEGEWLLTGTDRMKQRPMAPLVDALRSLGADIQYAGKEGCLPLRIQGKPIAGGKVSIDASVSSQFVSSLLLAAPMWPQGLELELNGNPSSIPYLDMTLSMMCHFSAHAERHGEVIIVKPQSYVKQPFVIEPDWSAASYWYEMAAFSEECEIRLKGLGGSAGTRYAPSAAHVMPTDEGRSASTCCLSRFDINASSRWQGDVVIAEWMAPLGVGTFAEGEDVVLRKIPFEKHPLHFDFFNHPDLYPTLAATCAGLGVEARFTGLNNLHLKESDRVVAMQEELAKMQESPIRFCSHDDHRIVMALAPLSMLVGLVAFDHPEVVEKSYPNFWKDADFLPIHN